MDGLIVRAAEDADRSRIVDLLTRSWGGTTVVAHGVRYDAARLSALLAERRGRLAGLLTYAIGSDGFEVVSLDAVVRREGAGTALMDAAADAALELGLDRVWLVTTNDNLDGLRFYQRLGMRIIGVNAGGVDESRKVKPGIPLVGDYGIEIHDEIILEWRPPRRGSRR